MSQTAKILAEGQQAFTDAVKKTSTRVSNIHDGHGDTNELELLEVSHNGHKMKLGTVASFKKLDSRRSSILPFDKSMTKDILEALYGSNTGDYQDRGDCITYHVPVLSEDERRRRVQQAQDEVEKSKDAVRNAQKEIEGKLRQKSGGDASEDEIRSAEADLQEKADEALEWLDAVLKNKVDRLMKF